MLYKCVALGSYLPTAFFDFVAVVEKGLNMVLKKICLSVYVFLLAGIAAFAQEGFELVGKVIDRETHEPLPYCAILNKSSGTFTITNVNGEFRLNRVKTEDTIQISMMGFEPASIAAGGVKQRGEIALAPRSIEVEEVVVRGIDSKKYLSRVYDKMSENFPAEYPTFDGIYRRQLLEDGRYVFLGECEVACRNTKAYETAPKVSVGQAYMTVNKADNKNVFSTALSSNLFLYPPYEYLFGEKFRDRLRWEFLGTKAGENGSSEVYVFSYAHEQGGRLVDEGKIYVDAQDSAVLRVDLKLYGEDVKYRFPRRIQLTGMRATVTHTYKKMNDGKYALSYSRSWCTFKFSSKKGAHEYTIVNDLLVTDYKSKEHRINGNASKNPFKLARETRTVAVSELKHLIPDYALDQPE